MYERKFCLIIIKNQDQVSKIAARELLSIEYNMQTGVPSVSQDMAASVSGAHEATKVTVTAT